MVCENECVARCADGCLDANIISDKRLGFDDGKVIWILRRWGREAASLVRFVRLHSHQALDTVGDLVSQTAVEIDDGRMRAHAARVEIEQPQTLHRSRTTERHVLRVRGEARARGAGEGGHK
jgi:hypothetical protein